MAGRIPQQFIDDLLDRTDLIELIGNRIHLKKSGGNYMACCPFHNEKTPSFSVNPNKQFYYCFGCGAGGNAISFLMDYEKQDFRGTIESLAQKNGMQIPATSEQEQQQQRKKSSLYDLLDEANAFYQEQLLYHAEKSKAIAYLKQRGLTGETTKHFGIGLAPEGWDNLKSQLATSNNRLLGLIEAGLIVEKEENKGTYDRFRNRLMFPIRDSRGRTLGFGGRVFDNSKPKYLNSPETPAFHKQRELYGLYEAKLANNHIDHIIVVEGYMDVIALAQFGITNAVATLGTSISNHHIEKIFRLCPKIIFCFDGDNAGRKAADRALQTIIPFMSAGKQAKFLFLPEGEDPDSLIQSKGKTYFENLAEKSQTLSDHLFTKHSNGLDLSKPDDKAELISKLAGLISQMPAGSYRELMFQELSNKTTLPLEQIKSLEAGTPPPKRNTTPFQPTQQTETPTKNTQRIKKNASLTAIRLLLFNPSLAQHKHDIEFKEHSAHETVVLKKIIDFIQKNSTIKSPTLIGHWLAHEKKIIEQALYTSLPETEENQQDIEYHDCMRHIDKQNNRINVKSFIESTKLNPNMTLNDMSAEERGKFLQLFKPQ